MSEKTRYFLLLVALNALVAALSYLPFLADHFSLHFASPTWRDYLLSLSYNYFVYFLFHLILLNPIFLITRKVFRERPLIFYFILSTSGTLLLLISFADVIIYRLLGIHVYDSVVINTVSNPDFLREIRPGFANISIAVLLLIFVLAPQTKLCQLIFKSLGPYLLGPKRKKIYEYLLPLFLFPTLGFIYCLFFYLPSQGGTANIFPLYTLVRGLTPQNRLTFKDLPTIPSKVFSNRPHIVLLMAESFRAQNLKISTMPKTLALLAERNNCTEFSPFFSAGHKTEQGVFSTLYSMGSHLYLKARKEKLESIPLNFLKRAKYQLKAFTASQLKNWMGAGFIFANFDKYDEFKGDHVIYDDRQVILETLKELKGATRPQFIFTFFNSTHYNYAFPPEKTPFLPIADEHINFFSSFKDEQRGREKIFNRYQNSVRYLDELIFHGLLSMHKLALKMNRDIVVAFTGDHGEEFWEHGQFGHANALFINERIQVPLIFCFFSPDASRYNGIKEKLLARIGSHTDILPTLFSFIFPESVKENRLLDGYSLLDKNSPRFRLSVAAGYPYEKNELAIISRKRKFWARKSTATLYSLYRFKTTDARDEIFLGDSAQSEWEAAYSFYSETMSRFLSEDSERYEWKEF